MRETEVQSCLAAMEAAERALAEAGDVVAIAHVSMAIDRFRATHHLPARPVDPALLGPIAEQF